MIVAQQQKGKVKNMKTTERIEAIMEYLKNHKDKIPFVQFKSTKSWYGDFVDINTDTVQARVRPVLSYKTIVGYFDCDEGVFYEYGKYTPTTSKQITQIYNKLWSRFDRVLVDVNPDFHKLDWGCRV